MLCPYCSNTETKVTDKRDLDKISRRRRECLKCGKRFSTRETVELNLPKVIKKSGLKESFDREKIKKGILRASEKRLVGGDVIEKMIRNVERKAMRRGKEVKSSHIGELVSRELKNVDKIAYIRFASIYRDFADLSDFKKEIRGLLKK